MMWADRLEGLLAGEEDWLGPAEECVREYRGEIDLPWPLGKMHAVEPVFSDGDWRALFEDERDAALYVALRNDASALVKLVRAAAELNASFGPLVGYVPSRLGVALAAALAELEGQEWLSRGVGSVGEISCSTTRSLGCL